MVGKRLNDIVSAEQPVVGGDMVEIKLSVAKSIPISVRQTEIKNHNSNRTPDHHFTLRNVINPEKSKSNKVFVSLSKYPENIIASKYRDFRQARARRGWVAQFALIAVILSGLQGVLPFPQLFKIQTTAAYTSSLNGYKEFEIAEKFVGQQEFDDAKVHFAKAEIEFKAALSSLRGSGQASSILPFLVDNASYSTAQALLEVASILAATGQIATDLGQMTVSALHTQSTKNGDHFEKASVILQSLLSDNAEMIMLADQIASNLEKANRSIALYANEPVTDTQLESIRSQAVTKVSSLTLAAKKSAALLRDLGPMLGSDRNRRYILLFLNNTELRPGGGFIGSFATFLVKKGKIESFDVETNIYKLDNAFLKTSHVEAPYPINQLNKDWTLRDANWDTTFAGSAHKVAWFYKIEAGLDVDGVIAIDTSFMKSLLEYTGPVDVPTQKMTLSSENVVSTLQYKSEKEYLENEAVRALNEPKKAIADAFPFVLAKVFNTLNKNTTSLLNVLNVGVAEKHLNFTPLFDQATSRDDDSSMLSSFPTDDDFLMVSNGNLGGLKSSLNIKQDVDVNIIPTDRQTLLHTVDITRTHNGSYNWPDGDNRNFIRLSVPKNAVYIDSSSTGLDNGIIEPTAYIEQFDNYQNFGHWLTTPVGATKTAHFEYETPIDSKYFQPTNLKFHYLKQPGWTYDNLKINFKNGQKYQFNSTKLEFKQKASRDLFWQIPMKKMRVSGIRYHV